jgi:hypothetical protein
MFPTTQKDLVILNAKAATGVDLTTGIMASDFRTAVIQLATASSAVLVVQIQAAVGATAPDFSAAASVSNPWIYVDAIDLADGSNIPGGTGLAWTGTDAVRMVEVNTNHIDWLNVRVISRSAGSVTAKANLMSDE